MRRVCLITVLTLGLCILDADAQLFRRKDKDRKQDQVPAAQQEMQQKKDKGRPSKGSPGTGATPDQYPPSAPDKGGQAPAAQGPRAPLEIDLTTVIGQSIPGRVDLLPLEDGPELRIEVPKGQVETQAPAGHYRAYIHVYDAGAPVLVDIRDVEVKEGLGGFVLLSLLEGAGGSLSVRGFDYDGDLAIDRVELDSGTDPYNAASIPGKPVLPQDTRVLAKEAKWYRGELHARSSHGSGTESVAELISRAEKSGMDFLAITDRNSLASIEDPGYASDKLVLIPAMEWGTDERGLALIYGPRTPPEAPSTVEAAQAECIRVQAQGGVFAIAHPCFPNAPWQWGLSYVNAVQVWCRPWREVPPMNLRQLGTFYQEREKLTAEQLAQGRKPQLVHSIAAAAAEAELAPVSANMQSMKFWDYEMARGLMAAPIAGSGTGSPKVPMGRPLTYIRAKEKSLPALLEGFRQGHVYVSSGVDGPQISFRADVLGDGRIDVDMGGVVPLDALIVFEISVANGQGKKLEVLQNGRPILSKVIEGAGFVTAFEQKPDRPCNYRVRVVGPPENPRGGFGPSELYAMSSPIYAQDITVELLARHPNLDLKDTWVRMGRPGTDEVQLPEQELPMQVAPLN